MATNYRSPALTMVADGQTPTVWVLLGKGAGGNGQLKSLAHALGWPYETKQLVYNRVSRCPNLLLGASVLGLDRRASSPLTPPWPGLVIAASRRSALKRRLSSSSPRTRTAEAQSPSRASYPPVPRGGPAPGKPWSRAKTIAWARVQTPSLSNTLET